MGKSDSETDDLEHGAWLYHDGQISQEEVGSTKKFRLNIV